MFMFNQSSLALDDLLSSTQEQTLQWHIAPPMTSPSSANPSLALIKAVKDREMDTSKKMEIVQQLIGSRVDIDFINYKKKTALVYAIRLSEIPIIQTLLDAKANPNLSMTLINAILVESIEITNILLHASKAFNPQSGIQNLIEQRDLFGQTPLIWAVAQRNIDLVTLLTKHNANVNVTDDHGNSPLIYATRPTNLLPEKMHNASVIISLLLEARAHLDHCNAYGNHALFYARKFKYKIVCQQFFHAGARLPSLQFDEPRNQIKEIEERVSYPIYDLLDFVKALLQEAQIPYSDRHFSIHHPLVMDLKEALEMASEFMALGTGSHVDKLELYCLLQIIKEKYQSQYAFLTDEQMEEAIDQKARIKAKTLKFEDFDYIDYDQKGLDEACAIYLGQKKRSEATVNEVTVSEAPVSYHVTGPVTDAAVAVIAKQQLATHSTHSTHSTRLIRPSRLKYYVLRHRIFGQGTTDRHYVSLRNAVKKLILSLSETECEASFG